MIEQRMNVSILEGDRIPASGDLVRMVAHTAARFPENGAVRDGGVQLTYGVFTKESWGLGRFLEANGVRGGTVGILSHPCVDAARAMLAVLSCRAAYVALNPDFPDDRLRAIVTDAQLSCILAHPEDMERAHSLGSPVFALRPPDLVPADEPAQLPEPDDLAYIMFTSGSTGKPKGVPIRHRGVVSLMESLGKTLGLGPAKRFLAVTVLSFDISVLEHFLPWWAGAETALLPRSTVRDGKQLARAIADYRPDFMQATPAGWRLLVEAGWEGDRDLTALTGGEALPPRLAGELTKGCRTLWNLYGPTETTIWSTVQQIQPGDKMISLGQPVANTGLYVLDPQTRQVVPRGQDGELCIGGIALSPGYLGRPDLTAERFVENPVPGSPDPRIYKTGDRVRLHEDGAVEYLGRIDFQVKLRGFRIELGEIEAVLSTHPHVRQGVVVLREDLAVPTLVAYMTGDPAPPAELRAFLEGKLPDYMIPGLFEWVANFALNPSGKVDRKALPRPTPPAPEEEDADPRIAAASAILGQTVAMGDDLFLRGLDSISAAQLARSLENLMGRTIPLDVILQGRTLEQISRTLGGPGVPPLIHLSPGPAQPRTPIVLLHTLTGSLPRDLAEALGAHRPVLGLRSRPDAEWGESGAPERLEQLATRAVEAIEELAMPEPLHLIGFSFGGVLGLEIAQQWLARGHRFGVLAVLDTDLTHLVPGAPQRLLQRVLWPGARLAELLRGVAPVGLQQNPLYRRLLNQACYQRLRRDSGAGVTDRDIDETLHEIPGFAGLPAINRQMARRHLRLEQTYQPGPFPGKVLLVRRLHTNPLEARALGWERVCSNLVVDFLPTTLHEVLHEQNYPLITRIVQQQLA